MLRYFQISALLALCLLTPAVAAESFTPEQRAAIIEIMRESLKQDPSILRDAVEALRSDDVRQRDDAVRAAIVAHHDAIYDPIDPGAGNPLADVTIVEFFDPRCPYCRQLEPMMEAWLRSDPTIRVVFKDLPILGPSSVLGSRALLAAQKQDGYQKLRNAMMNDSPDISEDSIREAAIRVGLDWPRLRHDMDDPAIQARLDANTRLARTLGIEGTPAFVVGDRLVVGSEPGELQNAVAAMHAERAAAPQPAGPGASRQ